MWIDESQTVRANLDHGRTATAAPLKEEEDPLGISDEGDKSVFLDYKKSQKLLQEIFIVYLQYLLKCNFKSKLNNIPLPVGATYSVVVWWLVHLVNPQSYVGRSLIVLLAGLTKPNRSGPPGWGFFFVLTAHS